jgi:D-sedoheptulose 7-phosphate isomerase
MALESLDRTSFELLSAALAAVWDAGGQVLLCGNGGSAANALHLANDFIYGLDPAGKGLAAHALPSNASVMTCLANDAGYDQVFSRQVRVLGRPGDLLLVLSGSGNSPNILRALESAREMGIRSAAILGFSGGKAKQLADIVLHFPVEDMQVCEDLQMVVGHMMVQQLRRL